VHAAYLDKLNPEQRRAVEHGAGPSLAEAAPLLVIAGAGLGKTNTLARRVAHLMVGGVDPRRILPLTFSRRAAAEMTRRAERILVEVMSERGCHGGGSHLGRHIPRHRRTAVARIRAGICR